MSNVGFFGNHKDVKQKQTDDWLGFKCIFIPLLLHCLCHVSKKMEKWKMCRYYAFPTKTNVLG